MTTSISHIRWHINNIHVHDGRDDIIVRSITTYMYVVNKSSYMWNRGRHGRDDIIAKFITTYMYVVNMSSYMWNRGRHDRDDIIVRSITTYM
jgi:predicted heme/steroid binding protein